MTYFNEENTVEICCKIRSEGSVSGLNNQHFNGTLTGILGHCGQAAARRPLRSSRCKCL